MDDKLACCSSVSNVVHLLVCSLYVEVRLSLPVIAMIWSSVFDANLK